MAILHDMINAGASGLSNTMGAGNHGVAVAASGTEAIRADTAAMREQAAIVNSQANAVNATAGKLANLAPQMEPYKAKLSNYGDDLSALGDSLTANASDIFGQGGALVNLDPSKGGLSAEYINQYNSLAPDQFVSRAASDVQDSFDNAMGQQYRDLARRGVSLSSGAAANLTHQLNRALAAASSAAKTNAWQKGKESQVAMLGQMTSAANTLYDMGTKTQAQGIAAKSEAAGAQKGAADVVSAQGSLISAAGGLQANAGQLFASAADIFGGAADAEYKAAGLGLDAAKNLMAAYGAAADYYGGIAKSMIGADAQTMSATIGANARVASAIAGS